MNDGDLWDDADSWDELLNTRDPTIVWHKASVPPGGKEWFRDFVDQITKPTNPCVDDETGEFLFALVMKALVIQPESWHALLAIAEELRRLRVEVQDARSDAAMFALEAGYGTTPRYPRPERAQPDQRKENRERTGDIGQVASNYSGHA